MVANLVKTGIRVRIANPDLAPVNPNFAMGASSEMELKINENTIIEVLEINLNTIDSSLYVSLL